MLRLFFIQVKYCVWRNVYQLMDSNFKISLTTVQIKWRLHFAVYMSLQNVSRFTACSCISSNLVNELKDYLNRLWATAVNGSIDWSVRNSFVEERLGYGHQRW